MRLDEYTGALGIEITYTVYTTGETMDPAGAATNKKILIIHGVNYFLESSVKKSVIERVRSWGCGYVESDIITFNWDLRMGDPAFYSRGDSLNLRLLIEIGAGLLHSAHFGFVGVPVAGYQGLSSCVRKIHNVLSFCFQCFSLILPMLLLGLIFNTINHFRGSLSLVHSIALLSVAVAHALLPVLLGYAGYALLLISVGFLGNSWSGFHVCLRRVLQMALWPLLCIITLPWALTEATFLLVLLVAGATWLIYINPFASSYDEPFVAYYLVFLSLYAISIFLTKTLLYAFRRSPLKNLLKILADISRYLGLDFYRRDVLDHLSGLVDEIVASNPSSILFLTHSLGSVIAVDFLLERGSALRNIPEIRLVTFGSPIKRLLHRFFPDFRLSPTQLSSNLQNLLPGCRWINVFRPHDPIGRSLPTSTGLIYDKSTGQNKGWFWKAPAHSSYWSDPTVFEEIRKGLEYWQASDLRSDARDLFHPLVPDVPASIDLYGWNDDESFIGKMWSGRVWLLARSDLALKRSCQVFFFGALAYWMYQQWSITHRLGFSVGQIMFAPAPGIGALTTAALTLRFLPPIWSTLLRPVFQLVWVCLQNFPPLESRLSPQRGEEQRKRFFAAEGRGLRAMLLVSAVALAIVVGIIRIQHLPTSLWEDLFSVSGSGYSPATWVEFDRSGSRLAVAGSTLNSVGKEGSRLISRPIPGFEWSAVAFGKGDCIFGGGISYNHTQALVAVWGPDGKPAGHAFFAANELTSIGGDCASDVALAGGLQWMARIDLKNRSPVAKVPHNGHYYVVSWDGRYGAFCDMSTGEAKLTDFSGGPERDAGGCIGTGTVHDLNFTANNEYFFTWNDRGVTVTPLPIGKRFQFRLDTEALDDGGVKAVALAGDGKRIAALIARIGGGLRIWNMSDRRLIAKAEVPRGVETVEGLVLGPDSQSILAFGDRSATLQRWHEIDWRQRMLWWLQRVQLK